MSNENPSVIFLNAAESWLCDGYSIDIRYFAERSGDEWAIWTVSIQLQPLRPKVDLQFGFEGEDFRLGLVQIYPASRSELLTLLQNARNGVVDVGSLQLALPGERLDFYSEMSDRNRWFSDLHLLVQGNQRPLPSPGSLLALDNALRLETPPFDGLADVLNWLGLQDPASSSTAPSISIRIAPPVDLALGAWQLRNDRLSLALLAHRGFDLDRVSLGVRSVPDDALAGRLQVASEIEWSVEDEDVYRGRLELDLSGKDTALVFLMIGKHVVRRQWLVDPDRARNRRLLAVHEFDSDLRMIKDGIFASTDSNRFEHGVAALLFLLGFSPCVQLEKDAPDLVVATPGGRLCAVECTTRISDFSSKVGKLVDRRGRLNKAFAASGHLGDIIAVLVCRLPRDQIPVRIDEINDHQVILITEEDLVKGLNRVRFQNDPDQMLIDALIHFEPPSLA